MLYIFWFLHQTTTIPPLPHPYKGLYIFWFLHQTTTSWTSWYRCWRCISFDSYIKPQPQLEATINKLVVYLLIPTSNHNRNIKRYLSYWLYIFWFLHQTTTIQLFGSTSILLYIFWFLHQTTTRTVIYVLYTSCISFDSYIKPQPSRSRIALRLVVYLLIPTSNHNLWMLHTSKLWVVYLLIPTSNHNIRKT